MSSKQLRRSLLLALLSGIPMLPLCTFTSLDNGGGSGTEISMVSGSVVDVNGNPIPDAVVHLRPADFLADLANDEAYSSSHSLLDTISGSDGTFTFSDIKPDSYVVEILIDDSLGAITDLRIGTDHQDVNLLPLTASPMAQLTGNARIDYGFGSAIIVQIYGIDRSANTDNTGNFNLHIPCGKHQLHIGAYTGDSTHPDEFDGFDLALQVSPGEQRDAGTFRLRPPPPPLCFDGSCDSLTVRSILDRNGYAELPLDSVTATENGRIVELSMRGLDMSGDIPFELNRLSELRLLDLGETGLAGMFPDIGRLSNLETVRLDGNTLQVFSTTIGYCKKLRELDLHGNQLTYLHPSITKCGSLELLDVSGNQLCFIDFSIAAWLDKKDPGWNDSQQCK